MAYGKIKVDTLTWDDSGSDTDVTISTIPNLSTANTVTGVTTIQNDVTLDGATAGRDIVFDRSENALEFADNAKARFGASNDLEIYHSGSESFIADEGTGGITISGGLLNFKNQARDETFATMTVNGSVDLYHDNTKRLETSAAGITVSGTTHTTGSFTLLDNGKLICGAGNDLQISSNGSKGILEGSLSQVATAVSALELDLNTSNYFTKTISGNSTFTFANAASSGTVTAFTLELTHSSGTVTWPSSVKWNADTAPTLTTGKTHLFMFVTDDGGARYRGSALVDYVN